MLISSAAMTPYCRAASTSNGKTGKGGFYSLRAQDPPGASGNIFSRVDRGRQLGEADRAGEQLGGQLIGSQSFQVSQDVGEAELPAPSAS